jgi:hypothetical protein
MELITRLLQDIYMVRLWEGNNSSGKLVTTHKLGNVILEDVDHLLSCLTSWYPTLYALVLPQGKPSPFFGYLIYK